MIWLIAARQLWTHRLRNAWLGGAVALETCLLVLCLNLGAGSQESLEETATSLYGHVGVSALFKASEQGRVFVSVQPASTFQPLLADKVPGVDYVARRGWSVGRIISSRSGTVAILLGMDPASEPAALKTVRMKEGSLAALSQPNSIVLFEEQARALHVKVGDSVVVSSRSFRGIPNSQDVRIVGVARSLGNLTSITAMVPLSFMSELTQMGTDATTELQLHLKEPEKLSDAQAAVKSALEARGLTVSTSGGTLEAQSGRAQGERWSGTRWAMDSWRDRVVDLQSVLALLEALMYAIALILTIVVSAGSMNAMWISVRERTREIGTLRAIGMQRGAVLRMFLAEAFLLSTFATLAGALLGTCLGAAFNGLEIPVPQAPQAFLLRDTFRFSVRMNQTLVLSALIVLCVTMVSMFPSWLAARQRPVDAMQQGS